MCCTHSRGPDLNRTRPHGLPPEPRTCTRGKAEQAIRTTLAAYLVAHPGTAPTSAVRVARVSDGSKVQLVGVGALLGAGRSQRKTISSKLNGRLDGRPRKIAQARRVARRKSAA